LLALASAAPPLVAAPAPDPQSPLALVPAQAPIVIHLRGFERTKERLTTMVKNALPALAGKVQEAIDEFLKEALDGRELKGLVMDGPIFVIFTEIPGSDRTEVILEKLAVLARINSYADFRDGLLNADERKNLKSEDGLEVTALGDQRIWFADRKDYAVVAGSKKAAQTLTKKQAGLDSKLDKDLAVKLLDADVAAYVDMTAVNKEFGEHIKEIRKGIEEAIKEAAAATGTGLDKNTIKTIQSVIGPLFQALADSRAALVTLHFQPDGLAVRGHVAIADDSKTNGLLKKLKPAALGELTRLPEGQMIYSGLQLGPELFEAFGPLMYGMVGDAEKKEVKAALDQLLAAKPRARYDSVSMPMQGLSVHVYDDPAKAAEAHLKLFQALGEGDAFSSGVLKGKPEVKAGAVKHRGLTLNSFRGTWDFEKMVAGQAELVPAEFQKQMIAAMKKLLGEGINTWFGTDGKVFLEATAPDWTAAEKLIDQYLDGKAKLGDQQAFKDSRKQVAGEATLIALIDLPQFARIIYDMVQTMFMGTLPQLPAGKSKATYTAFAVTLKAERVSFELYVPCTTADEIYKLIEPIIKAFGGLGQ
jgi:hypothetical protein